MGRSRASMGPIQMESINRLAGVPNESPTRRALSNQEYLRNVHLSTRSMGQRNTVRGPFRSSWSRTLLHLRKGRSSNLHRLQCLIQARSSLFRDEMHQMLPRHPVEAEWNKEKLSLRHGFAQNTQRINERNICKCGKTFKSNRGLEVHISRMNRKLDSKPLNPVDKRSESEV